MQGNPAVIESLTEILTAELTAINQYFIHAKMCDNWGFERLAKHNYDESMANMRKLQEEEKALRESLRSTTEELEQTRQTQRSRTSRS